MSNQKHQKHQKHQKYQYSHLLPTDTVYQMPRPGYPRMKRNEQYQLAQSAVAQKYLKPNAIFERRYKAFMPNEKKSITIQERIQRVEKLQKKSVDILSKRMKKETDFLSKIKAVKEKLTKKIAESNKKRKEVQNEKNNTQITRLTGEIAKLSNNVSELIKKEMPMRTELEEVLKQNSQLQTSISQYYYGTLNNHLIYGNSQRAFTKRAMLISNLLSHRHGNNQEMHANAIKVLNITRGAKEKLNPLELQARNNQYKAKLTLPRSTTGSYKLPIKLTHNSGTRKSLKNIRKEYSLIKQREKGMNINNTRASKINGQKELMSIIMNNKK
jgi:hypothetical protein